jgi:CheY-like chemotaxis protein
MKPLRRILFVEDDPDIRSITTLSLSTIGGFTVEDCSSGRQAVARASAFAPDLLLLDVMLRGMSGLAALKALRRLPGVGDTPVVFMTARVQPRDLAVYQKEGCLAVIRKPFEPRSLSERLTTIWRQHHHHAAAD